MTLAGSGSNSAGSVDGVGTAARFFRPQGLAVTSDGAQLFVADTGSYKIRRITVATAVVSTMAGSGVSGNSDGIGTSAAFSYPIGLALTADDGTLFIADRYNNKVFALSTSTNAVTTVAGTGALGNTDGAAATATLEGPIALAVSRDDTTVYIVEFTGHRVRALHRSSVISMQSSVSTLAGSRLGVRGYLDGVGTEALFNNPAGAALSPDGRTLYLATSEKHKIKAISLVALAGTHQVGSEGETSVSECEPWAPLGG